MGTLVHGQKAAISFYLLTFKISHYLCVTQPAFGDIKKLPRLCAQWSLGCLVSHDRYSIYSKCTGSSCCSRPLHSYLGHHILPNTESSKCPHTICHAADHTSGAAMADVLRRSLPSISRLSAMFSWLMVSSTEQGVKSSAVNLKYAWSDWVE